MLVEVHDLNASLYIDRFLDCELFFKISILRTYSLEAEHLSLRDRCFTVLAMAAVHANKLTPTGTNFSTWIAAISSTVKQLSLTARHSTSDKSVQRMKLFKKSPRSKK